MAQSGARRHAGLFLNADVGAGYANGSNSGVSIYGPAGTLGVAVGGAVAENLILAGHYWGAIASNPGVSANGMTGATENSSIGLDALGPELLWYAVPANVFISATIGLGRFTATVDGSTASTDVGFAGQLGIGKEWWVSDRWALGLAGQLAVLVNNDPAVNSSWSSLIGSMVLSVTYN